MELPISRERLIKLAGFAQSAALWGLLVVLALWVTHVYAQRSHFGGHDYPIDVTSPHAYHFVPMIAECLYQLLPMQLILLMGDVMERFRFISSRVANQAYFPVFALVLAGFVFGYGYMLRKITLELFPDLPGAGWMAAMMGLYSIPAFAYPELHYYDFAYLFLCAAAFYALLKQRMQLYLICFVLAAVNELKIGWLILFFLIYQRHTPQDRATTYFIASVQFLFLSLASIYMYMRMPESFRILLPDFALSFSTFLYAYDFNKLIYWCMAALLFTYRFPEKPFAIRLSFWLGIPYALLYFNHAPEFGLRVFYGIHPFIVLIFTSTVVAFMREGGLLKPRAD